MGSTVSCHKMDKKTLEFNDKLSYRVQPSHPPLIRDKIEENCRKFQEDAQHVHSNCEVLDEVVNKTEVLKKESAEFMSCLNDAGKVKQLGLEQVSEHARLTAQETKKLLAEQNEKLESVEEQTFAKDNRPVDLPLNEDTILEESMQLRDTSEDTTHVRTGLPINMTNLFNSNTRHVNNGYALERSTVHTGQNHLENNRPAENETLEQKHVDSGFTETGDTSGESSGEGSVRDANDSPGSKESGKSVQEADVVHKTSESTTDNKEHDVEQILLTNVRESIALMKRKKWVTSEGRVSKGAINILGVLQQASSNINALSKAADILLETNTVDKICELVIYIQKQVTEGQFNEKIQTLYFTMGVTLGVLVNYTDSSEGIVEKVTGYPGVLDVLRQILIGFSEKRLHEMMAVTEEDITLTCIINNALSVVYNISLVESSISHLRKLNFTEALQPYLTSKDRDDHLTALAALACITDEREAEIINSNRKVVKYLMKVLRRALRAGDRRYAGWSCKELAVVIKTLARNDANKKLLVHLGALKLLVKLTKGNTEETIEAVGATWALSFDEDNRRLMIEDEALGVISALSQLRKSDCDKIKTAANGALWNLREDLRTSKNDSYKAIGEKIVAQGQAPARPSSKCHGNATRKSREGHIMISYQWSNQKILTDVRNELNKNGFKIWMDVDNMAGSTLQAMAEAIENADLVLLCYSQKYKNSPNCRAEAEYTFQRQKPFLPLRMEMDYKPDGWLGILVGTKLFYDFSGKYEFQSKLNQLLKEVRRLESHIHDAGTTITPVVPTKIEPVYHHAEVREDGTDSYHGVTQLTPVTVIADKVRIWTQDDVRNWVRKHNLPEQECAGLTADEIALLIEMKGEAPEAFYKSLQKKFDYDLKLISQLVRALKAIDT